MSTLARHLNPEDCFIHGIQDGTFPIITEGTGRGKTYLACRGLITKRYSEVTGISFKRTIIITPYDVTRTQMLNEHEGSGVKDLRELGPWDCGVFVGTFALFALKLKERVLDLSDTLLIIDEIHRLVFNST